MTKAPRSLVLIVVFLCSLCSVVAQTTGSISGEVRDEKQAIIPNATVTVRNVGNNQTRTAQTDEEGRYRFTGMDVGDYEVTVEATGFAKHVQSGITLVLNQPATVVVTMKPGSVTEVVNVTEKWHQLFLKWRACSFE